MKAIHTMNIEELAEHLSTLDLDWSQCIGAKTQFGRVLDYSTGLNNLFYCAKRDRNRTQGWMRVDECRLDLEDPATLGCVLAMVRVYLGNQNIHLRHEHDLGWNLALDEPGRETWFLESLLYFTEAHALIAATQDEE